jgi:hypothetical protein
MKFGVPLMLVAVGLCGCHHRLAEPPLALCDKSYVEHDPQRCSDYNHSTDTSVTNLPSGGCSVCNELIRRSPNV